MWAPQISADQRMEFSSPKSVTCWGWGGSQPGGGGCHLAGPGPGPPGPSGLWPVALHAWMDTEGLLHGAINILFMNVSGFSRQTMHYFMVGKNQRKFKVRVELKLC